MGDKPRENTGLPREDEEIFRTRGLQLLEDLARELGKTDFLSLPIEVDATAVFLSEFTARVRQRLKKSREIQDGIKAAFEKTLSGNNIRNFMEILKLRRSEMAQLLGLHVSDHVSFAVWQIKFAFGFPRTKRRGGFVYLNLEPTGPDAAKYEIQDEGHPLNTDQKTQLVEFLKQKATECGVTLIEPN